jgi:mannose-6-phosphate isomerase-like protein (cupin superfamily)
MNAHTIVLKLWGYELWIVNNNQYCGKVLHFHGKGQSSLHKHDVKHETMLVTSGECLIERINEAGQLYDTYLEKGQSIILPPGTYHRMKPVNGEAFTLVEFSTPHSDDDVLRLEESRPI